MGDSNIVQGYVPGEKRPYTYVLLYPDGKAFYYGKGTGKRIFQHRKEAQSGMFANRHKNHTIRKIWATGEDYQEIILAYHNTEQDAFMHEIALIFLSGDSLTNLTIGGEGPSGLIPSEEHRRKLSEAKIGHIVSPETRRKLSEASKVLWQDKEYRHKNSTSHQGYTASPETRHKLSKASKGRTYSEEFYAHMGSEARKGKALSEEHRRKIGDANRGGKRSEETRRKMSEAQKQRWQARKEQAQ